jgi:NADH-quinone oxidoreductase subunit E
MLSPATTVGSEAMPRRAIKVSEPEGASAPEASEFDFDPIREIVAATPDPPGSLISILQRVQKVFGYLPEPVVQEIARLSEVPASRIYGVITFYAQFTTVPSGRHKVCVCQGTACHVRGAHEVLRAVEKALGVGPGDTTPDLDFGFATVACLGACSFAPVMTVDGQYYAKMKGSRVAPILSEFGHGGRQGGET